MAGFDSKASYFDGETAASTEVAITINANGVQFKYKRKAQHWAMEDIRSLDDQAMDGGIVLEREDESTERLVINDSNAAHYLRSLPNMLGRRKVSATLKRRVLKWGAGAIGSVALILFVIIPLMANTLAGMIPVASEEALGRKVLKQIGWVLDRTDSESLTCETPDGLAALQKMSDRLSDHFETEYTLNVQVFRVDQVNAFAAPGGYVVLFDGLLQEADSPEEVAGVMAHEYGHVVMRDPTRLTLRSAGSAGILSMLIGDFGGGFLALIMAEQLLSAQYSQSAEAEADQFAHDVFERAGLPSSKFADFFKKLHDKYGSDEDGFSSYFSTHPELLSRQLAAQAADTIGDREFEPTLSKAEWDALRAMCDATSRPSLTE